MTFQSVQSVSSQNACLVLHNLGGDTLQELLRQNGRLRLHLFVPTRGVSTFPVSKASPNVTRELKRHQQSLRLPQMLEDASLGNFGRHRQLPGQLPDKYTTEYDKPTEQDLAWESSWSSTCCLSVGTQMFTDLD